MITLENEIIEAAAIAINESFEQPLISMEHVKQSLEPPCFVIDRLEASRTEYVGHWLLTVPLDILYFPKSAAEPRREMFDMASKLYQALEVVTDPDGDMYRGRDMSDRVVDGVLHFYVTYSIFVYKVSNHEYMMSQKIKWRKRKKHGSKN